jgi:ribonucleoside-diphosphate reductase beta chain
VKRPGLLTARRSYKPIAYPWALDACRRQHQVHWLPEEAQLGEDIQNWNGRGDNALTDAERAFLTNVFRFFTQSDVEVNDCYMTKYAQVFRPTEVRMMLAAFSGIETVHILAYALLLETLGLPDDEFSAFLDVPSMVAKVDFMDTFGVRTHDDILRTTAMFGGATEGLSLYGMFAMLMNFPRRNRMKGMGQIVSWSVRDESLHAASIIHLHNTLAQELGGRSAAVEADIVEIFHQQVRLEDAFVDTAFEVGGEVPGLTPAELKAYVRFVADWRLRQLRLPEQFGIGEHPLPWLQSMLSAVEHQNFFEGRATEYSKAASRGSWYGDSGVWAAFERHPERRPENYDAAAGAWREPAR